DREDGVAATESCSGDAAQVVRPQRAAELALPVTTLERRSAVASGGTPIPRISIESNMVIRTGQTSIEVDSLERAVAQVRLLAGRVGGYVANTTVQTGRGQLRSATLEVKIPADRFEDGLGGLAALGKLESVTVIAEAFKQAWRNFVALVAACIRSLGVVIPLGVLVAVAWVSAKRFLPLLPRSAGH